MRTTRSTAEGRRRLLAKCPLFQELDQLESEILASGLVTREFARGEYLCFQEDPAKGFFIVVEGEVVMHRTGPDGREQVLQIMREGDIIGEAPLFQGASYPASARAKGRVEVLYLSREKFHRLGKKHPEILFAMLRILAGRLRRFVNLIDDLSLKEVSSRLAVHILELRKRGDSNSIELETSKGVLASRLGTIPETLSRIFRKMQEKGIVDVQGKTVTILNMDLLEDVASGGKI